MMQVSSHHLEALRTVLAGKVITPEEADYDTMRIQWNNDIDRRPVAIAHCLSPADIASALAFAREQELEISVRGGGHAFSGTGVCHDGLMIDLSGMRHVSICAGARLAQVGGGTTVAELDAATQVNGLAVPAGVISHTGVGGLTLGGGTGWLTHRAGLTIDNLVSADVVLADGRYVHASPDEHADLFWAVRGGGGNFGVVTTFEFRLHPVGPEVHLGLFFWGMDNGEHALRLARDVVPNLPIDAGAQISTPRPHHSYPRSTTSPLAICSSWSGSPPRRNTLGSLRPFVRRCRRCLSSSPQFRLSRYSGPWTRPLPGGSSATKK
jgi:FAD/FMN-containing dehydrogenase